MKKIQFRDTYHVLAPLAAITGLPNKIFLSIWMTRNRFHSTNSCADKKSPFQANVSMLFFLKSSPSFQHLYGLLPTQNATKHAWTKHDMLHCYVQQNTVHTQSCSSCLQRFGKNSQSRVLRSMTQLTCETWAHTCTSDYRLKVCVKTLSSQSLCQNPDSPVITHAPDITSKRPNHNRVLTEEEALPGYRSWHVSCHQILFFIWRACSSYQCRLSFAAWFSLKRCGNLP